MLDNQEIIHDSIHEQFDRAVEKQRLAIPALRLTEKLSLLKNRIDSSKKRWFWELLQNASDYNETVNIKLVVSEDSITFFHDGGPFSFPDILNLISPYSDKQDDEVHHDNIGKFGTGFVSTHILSSVIIISGICVDYHNESYKFSITLDRSRYTNRQDLIEQIAQATDRLEGSLRKCDPESGFCTSFSYQLGKPLPDLPPINASDIDLGYLYESLPFTLCFMPKVLSVVIEDRRPNAKDSSFRITRAPDEDNIKVFNVSSGNAIFTQKYVYFHKDDISSAFRIENNSILEFPKGLSRLFCGLPLIGTEEIGIPFLLNSLKFMPTTEREGVEIDPNSNPENVKLFKASENLYSDILDYIARNKLRNAFHLTKLNKKFNGTQASNQQFQNRMQEYKKSILNHQLVVNENGEYITFASMILPFKESKPDIELYSNCKLLNRASLPAKDDYLSWFDATDFKIFPEQEYTKEHLAKQIQEKENIYSFGKTLTEITEWLYNCNDYLLQQDRFIFSKYKLLPNQSGTLCFANGNLYADNELPEELKQIYDSLYAIRDCKIGDKLLDKNFTKLGILTQEYTLENLAQDIDNELSSQYSNNNGNTSAFSSILNCLYSWINRPGLSREWLATYFRWYYPKRATLIVDMLSETQREQALEIAESGKMESLAMLAKSDLTDEEIRMVIANIKRIPAALELLSNRVDDESFANSQVGNWGEEFVYRDLLQKYPRTRGFNVIWASRDRGEPRYDFEVTKNGKIYCYCDAKTTSRGIANADSIPFFIRKSQWDFLQNLEESAPYIIARVFVRDGGIIKYIRIISQNQ